MPCAWARRNSGPRRTGPSWGGTEPGGPSRGPDRRRAGSEAELAELALDPDAAPARVLPGQSQDERTAFGLDRRPARPTGRAVRPLPAYELALPAEERRRPDQEDDPTVTRDRPADRREQDPVDGPELRSARRPLQHPEPMAQDEDLEVLGAVVPVRSTTPDEHTDEGADHELEERPHHRIVLGGPDRESGFLTPTGLTGRLVGHRLDGGRVQRTAGLP